MSALPLRGRGTGRLAGWLGLVGALVVLNYSSRLLAGDTPVERRDIFYLWSTAVGTLVQFGLMLAIILWIAAGAPARELLALRRPRSWKAAAGWAAGVLVGIFVLSLVLGPLLRAGEEQGLTPEEWDPSRATPFVANFVLVSTFVPVVEELMFRGAGFSLLERFGGTFAIVGSALLFGLAHGLVRALPVLVAFGLGLGWLRRRSNSVVPGIVLHGAFNAIGLLASVTLEGTGDG
ncbi:MAG: CPBP family intramembrane metalloprotease [Actinobacteria bacterium]|nr:CPBP family intramembrane metalloprotease [Actinomycetota bacterium]